MLNGLGYGDGYVFLLMRWLSEAKPLAWFWLVVGIWGNIIAAGGCVVKEVLGFEIYCHRLVRTRR